MTTQLSSLQFISTNIYDYLYIQNSINFNTNGLGQASISITHNLGYVPFVRLWVVFPGDSNIYQVVSHNFLNAGEVETYSITTTNIILTVDFCAPNSTGTFYYRIYKEQQV